VYAGTIDAAPPSHSHRALKAVYGVPTCGSAEALLAAEASSAPPPGE
jgi:hypothetical protein